MGKTALKLSPLAKQCYLDAFLAWQQRDLSLLTEKLKRLAVAAPDSVYLWRLQLYLAREQNKMLTAYKLAMQMLAVLLETAEENDKAWQDMTAEAWSLYGELGCALGKDDCVEAFVQAALLESEAQRSLTDYSNALFAANYREHTQAAWGELYQGWRELLQEHLGTSRQRPRAKQHAKLRLGYLSSDFNNHPVSAFAQPLLEDYTSDDFEVYVYATGKEDDVSRRLQGLEVHWRKLQNRMPEEIAAVIRTDEIDILMELGGHTANNQLAVLAYRPAVLQLMGLGYMGSTGMAEVDYVLGDAVLDRCEAENEKYFTEQLLVLPHSHFCYRPLGELPVPGALPCLRNGYITFGSLNNFAKVSDAVLRVWGQILRQVPGARLLLKHKLFNGTEGCNYTLQRMQDLGIDTSRVCLQGYGSRHLLTYQKIDIALDTFPYTGGMTTCEALAMGVPVLTLGGERHGSRFSTSLLENIGLPELCAGSEAEYLQRAVSLAANWDLLQEFRKNLRNILFASPVCDRKQYMQEIEAAYKRIWREHLSKESL